MAGDSEQMQEAASEAMEVGNGTNHTDRMSNFLRTGIRYDVQLIVGKTKIPLKAHSQILIAASPVFDELLQPSVIDASQSYKLDLPEFDPLDFIQILQFMYTGNCINRAKYGFAYERAGKKFLMPDLEELGRTALEQQLEEDAVLRIFEQAREFGHTDLENACLKYICRNGFKIIQRVEFSELLEENLAVILAQDALDAQELELFKALMKWGEAECNRNGKSWNDLSDKRSTLENLIFHIRFPVMDKEEFSLEVPLAQVLTMDELLSIMIYFNVRPEKRNQIPTGRFNSTARSTTETCQQHTADARLANPTSINKLKLVVLGDSATGKTAYLQRAWKGTFSETFSTIGMDFHIKVFQFKQHSVTVHVFDTAGQERFLGMVESLINGTHGFIITYDVTNRKTFTSVETWLNTINAKLNKRPQPPILICGMKIDMDERREVGIEEGSNFAASRGHKFIETSSKTGLQVDESLNLMMKAGCEWIETSHPHANLNKGKSCRIS